MNDRTNLGAFRWDSGLVAMSPQSERPKTRKVKMKKLRSTGFSRGSFRLAKIAMAEGKV